MNDEFKNEILSERLQLMTQQLLLLLIYLEQLIYRSRRFTYLFREEWRRNADTGTGEELTRHQVDDADLILT